MNEWYARDISRKIKSAMHTKALAGKHLTGFPVYGYKQDPADKTHWVMDEEAAEVVREIFQLCLGGYGPCQIENILNDRGIDSPSVHQHKNGINNRGDNILWGKGMVAKILGRMDYLGHTVSGRTYKKSYKGKRTHENERDKWIITENTHAQIIEPETWERVQKIREGRRRPTLMGEMGPLNGMLFCHECGATMKISRHAGQQAQYFVCSTYYIKRNHECTLHMTNRFMLEEIVLGDIQEVTKFARKREKEFAALVERLSEKTAAGELRSAKAELDKGLRRIAEIDRIIKKLYEDNASGRLADERFDKMYAEFETEQSALKARTGELTVLLENEKEKSCKLDRFMALVRKYTDVSELTAEIARLFIDKIVLHQAVGKGRARKQEIDIYYNFIGLLKEE